MSLGFNQSVLAASRRPEATAAIAELYDQVQREIALRRPVCVISGRCCHFEEFGHRLFVTTLEMAAFVRGLSTPGANALSAWDGSGCPFQKNKLCSVHPIRPFGCRMFFCDATSTEWQNEQYERFHGELKRLHERLEVPYFYIEWREALRQCPSPTEDIL